jgi:uncharacterized membrane protein YgcG
MSAARIALALALLLFGMTAAHAQTERILDFVSDVDLQPDAVLDVTETIRFNVLGTQVRHGINRDFPTDYLDAWGLRATTGFVLEDARLDGDAVPAKVSRLENGVRIRIGDPDRLVPPGIHTYTIHYLTWWQVSFGPNEDSLDWNVTGNGWDWSIDRAELRLHGLQGLVWNNVRVFTGPQGSRAGDAQIIRQAPGFLDLVTTRPLSPYEGLTVAAFFPKGVLRQPSQLQVAAHWVSDNLEVAAHWVGDNLALSTSFLGMVGIGFYVGWLFLYGAARPPAAIVPQFAPPNGFSAAMVGYLEDKGWLLDRDFSAGIVGLAVARHLKLIHGDGTYRLVRQEGGEPVTDLETQFEGALFRAGDELSLSDRPRVVGARAELDNFMRGAVMPALLHKEPRKVRPARTIAIATIVLTVAAGAIEYGASEVVGLAIFIGLAVIGALILATAALKRGEDAFAVIDTGSRGDHRVQLLAYQLARRRWGIAVIGLPMLALGLAGAHLVGPSLFRAALCLAATAALARASWCLRLTVPTAEGWKRRDEIEGLKLFFRVAEADRLRVLNPPDFTPALYEKLLPCAIALGVEMVWSRRFAAALAASQIQYEPDWYDGSHPWNRSDTADFSSDLGGGLTTAIAAASTPSSGGGGGGSDSSDGDSSDGGSSDGGSSGGSGDGGGGGGSGW